jgi:PKD repeat protein
VSTQVAIAPLLVSVIASPSSDTEPQVGDVVGFTASTTPSGALIDAYTWNFGDGTDPQTSQSFQVVHTYHSSGTKTVTACLTIAGGGDAACGIGSVVVKP